MEYITIPREILTEHLQEITRLLLKLGLTPEHNGYWPCVYAIFLTIQDPARLNHVTKCLYPDVGKAFDVKGKTVERAIRMAASCVWETHREKLCNLAEGELTEKPSASKFLSILALYFVPMIVAERAGETVKIPAGPSGFLHTQPEHNIHNW